ncbi:MAG: DsbA family protein [Bacteroidetes bacterium]|nr:DsbA family protein [Bacteroidota bacterium]
MKPLLIYCYDAYCGWCYGFSPVMKKIAADFSDTVEVEVLSGGMMIGDRVMPIAKIGPYIQSAYHRVEELTGIRFGKDFLWHTAHPEESDWVMNSEKPAIALSIIKEIHPEQQLFFASNLQYALNYEGRDLDDDEAYRHLLPQYHIKEKDFYSKLHNDAYKEKAYYEFALCKQLRVDSFPQVLLQLSDSKFFLLAKGFTPYDDLKQRIDTVLLQAGA